MIKIYSIFKHIIEESIAPQQAANGVKAINTVLNKERKIGFILDLSSEESELFNSSDKMESIKVPKNPHSAFVIYRSDVEGAKEDAIELTNLADKYGGYLPVGAGKDTYRIGILLGYNENDVKKFVKEKGNSQLIENIKKL